MTLTCCHLNFKIEYCTLCWRFGLVKMASSRKRQDEKHLKILRSLVSLPGNKQCFDCNQRGPTYVNVTIGSFVCTTCSGLLRGLTPPHRVKSISMTTFTAEEIESLQLKGNEYCRKVWLALYDSNKIDETKDEHLVRDFMVAKYEKKLYYMEPSALLKSGNCSVNEQSTARINVETSKNQHCLPDSSPAASINFNKLQVQDSSQISSVSNLNSTDPFRITFPPSKEKNQIRNEQIQFNNQESSFANFDNNPIFNSSIGTNHLHSLKSDVIAEDKYAALKDLDCLMKMQQGSPQNQMISGNVWSAYNTCNKTRSLNPFQNDIKNNNVINPFRLGLIQQAENNKNNDNFGTNAGNHCNNSNNPWGTENSWIINSKSSSANQNFSFSNPDWNGGENISIIPGSSSNPFL